jgi:8-oxo-dGTP diphosphatase
MTILTVDALIESPAGILLIERAKPPFLGTLSLPGGHVESSDRSPEAACVRELREETGIRVEAEELKLLTVLADPGRDPRPGNRVSIVYALRLPSRRLSGLKAGSDARRVRIVPAKRLRPEQIAFDHWKAIWLIL